MDPNTTPLSRPPPGVESDLNAANTKFPFQVVLSIACSLLCVLPVAVRIYTRRVILKDFKLDDCESAPSELAQRDLTGVT